MELDWTQGALAEGLRCYNVGEFFEAHEAWEGVWLTLPRPEKTFLQGLIQVTVAMHHLSRGNRLGATRLLTAALAKVEPHAPCFLGISVQPLCEDIRGCLALLGAEPAAGRPMPPRIQPSSSGTADGQAK